jgi:hypothetical protein
LAYGMPLENKPHRGLSAAGNESAWVCLAKRHQ